MLAAGETKMVYVLMSASRNDQAATCVCGVGGVGTWSCSDMYVCQVSVNQNTVWLHDAC